MIKWKSECGIPRSAKAEAITNEFCPSFSGIVAGECAGELWVDDLEHPRLALAYSYPVGGYAFLGNFATEEAWSNTQAFIMEEHLPWLKAQGVSAFEFSIESEELREPLLRMFADKTIQQEQEYRYRKSDWLNLPLRLPNALTFQAVDDAFWHLIGEGLVENAELLSGRLLESWGSYNKFAKRSLAYCIMDGQRIVAVIVGTARFNDVIPIDIETESEYRSKGLGLVLAQAFVNGCAEKGLTAEWDCMESNPASQRVAAKAGFSLVKQGDVFWFAL
jgi:RimJ/RimL family protein N-acetyltransferase